MASMLKVASIWTGASGLPGYTNLYFASDALVATAAVNAATAVKSIWTGLSTMLPSLVTVTVQLNVEEIEDTDGHLVADHTIALSGNAVTGTDSGSFSAPTGVVSNWKTASIHHGHRVRGRTFFVPMANTIYQSDGTIASSPLTSIRAAMTTYLAMPGTARVVWARPTASAAGAQYPVTGFTVPDKAAVLRSRRD